jgi:DNA-binding NarL/FixJ family response regulator
MSRARIGFVRMGSTVNTLTTTQAFSTLALQTRRAVGAVVGRPLELAAIQEELASAAQGRLAGITVEGEPGIGKTRLIAAASEMAASQGFITIAVAADEEIRGPLLLARSILGAPEGAGAAKGTPAAEAIQRSLNALVGNDDPGLASLAPDQKLMRTLDLAALAVRSLAEIRPVALFLDDLQWADDDSLRLLRYIVRADAGSPIFLMAALRPDEFAFVTEAVNLIADMERLGMVRRLTVKRFTPIESGEFLKQLLGGKVDPAGAAAMHAQAEGVPFIVEELVRAYREAGMVQQIDGTWKLAQNADRLVPSAVRTLISRRAARVPDETKAALSEAAILGRHFSLKDLQAVRVELGDTEPTLGELEEAMTPAVTAGLLLQHKRDSPADYSFAHEQVREYAAATLTPARRRAIHGAIVQLLMAGEPAPESLPLLAHHARAAGNAELCVRFSIRATRNALNAHAPEEVLRVVDLSLPTASTPQDRLALLQARDEALDMLRRPNDRLEGLAELAALAEALGDAHMEMDVQLRRAAALRRSQEFDQAATLARRIRARANEQGDGTAELAACLELGQDLLESDLGEAYSLPHDVDPEGAEEAFLRAVELAEQLDDQPSLAAAHRELGVIELHKVRTWFVETVSKGEHIPYLHRSASGESLDDILLSTPIVPYVRACRERFEKALAIYQRIGDQRGAMSAIIAMAYASWAPDIHLGSGAGRHIEEIRRLASRMDSMTKESERQLAEAQMLYGAHVFSRAKVVPDVALSRGEEAYRKAKVLGDRSLEFMAAGGTALAHLELDDLDWARTWLDRAATVAAEAPTPYRTRQLEVWRGQLEAAAGNADAMRAHLERALHQATEQGLAAARCETLAVLAMGASRLGAERKDEELLALATRAANEAKTLMEQLPGHAPWGAQADTALARMALARGDRDAALDAARSAVAAILAARHEDSHLEVLVPVTEVLAATSPGEADMARGFLQMLVALTAQRTYDEDVRVRWFRSSLGRETVQAAGTLDGMATEPTAAKERGLDEDQTALLKLLTEGLTNQEIAERLAISPNEVTTRLVDMFARIGAGSRAEATAFAFRERVV